MNKLPVILCVDDELTVLNSLKSQLVREFSEEYEIEVLDRGEDAVSLVEELLLEGREIPLLITDQLMPGMKGNELLREINTLSPKTFKILLTGQADVHAVADALNFSKLYRFIAKPWDGTDLLLTVREALRSFYQDKKLEEQNVLLQRYNQELEELVKERTVELEREKEKSDRLLVNILPHQTALELKEKGHSQPRHYEKVTILFTDFSGFTKVAAKLSPIELVERLGECFSAFDGIISKYKLEKIKTIGDSYMCAGGVPAANESNPFDMLHAALEIRDWTHEWNSKAHEKWELRIGVHTGKVVAGVIGSSKFAYDVWGDAVNIASRIETACEPGKINISADTFSLVQDAFDCTYRGEIDTKNRGLIKMYYLNGQRS